MAVKTKAQILAEITSLFADNTTGDISASDLRTVCNDIVDSYLDAPYLEYEATLTQSGSSAPVATVLKNTLGGTLVWARSTDGVYTATLASAFTANRTSLEVGQNSGVLTFFYRNTTSQLVLNSVNLGMTNADDLLSETKINIKVWA